MAAKITLVERVRDRLKKLGLTDRKAKELAKGVAPTAPRIKGNVTEKLTLRLVKLGLNERKAKELAKGLAPTVRTAIKAKARKSLMKLQGVTDDMVEETVADTVDAADDAALDTVAPRVNGHRVRLDLPVAPMVGLKGIELLRVMHGLTSTATYLVAAVKGDTGIIAIRRFDAEHFNVKFYPNMAFWKQTPEKLEKFGAESHLQRQWYERMHFDRGGLEKFLWTNAQENKSKTTRLIHRLFGVTIRPLLKAFDYLHQKVAAVA